MEFAFDVDIKAVVRVQADSLEEARKLLADDTTLTHAPLPLSADQWMMLTESTVAGDPDLFEIDGEDLSERCSNEDCLASLSDNEGYDELCGDCVDRAENERRG